MSRLTPEEGLSLFKNAGVPELGVRAGEMRFKKNPGSSVTFLIDSNPNYTNLCSAECSFCAFWRTRETDEAFLLSVEDVMSRIDSAQRRGATTVLLQGGCHPELPLEYHLSLIRECRKRFPAVTPHFFSAPEISALARHEGVAVRTVLEKMKEAGLVSLPGGGAEILSEKVRKRISPKKCSVSEWLEVHRSAHGLGIRSTATMMFGHVETPEDVITHLENIRDLQDETGGFTAFIPWSFKPGNTALKKEVPKPASPVQYLRLIAFSRIYLDNFQHIQASWFSEGKSAGQIALHFGADDMGGTVFDENVHRAAGHEAESTAAEISELIREAGFTPVQRTTLYEPVRGY